MDENKENPLSQEEQEKLMEQTLDELSSMIEDDNADVNEIRGKLEKLKDGTEILRGEYDEGNINDVEEDELTLQDKRAIYRFVKRVRHVDNETLEAIEDDEWEYLQKVSGVLLNHFSYLPKKKFNKAYRKKRQHKNKMAKRQRQINARR